MSGCIESVVPRLLRTLFSPLTHLVPHLSHTSFHLLHTSFLTFSRIGRIRVSQWRMKNHQCADLHEQFGNHMERSASSWKSHFIYVRYGETFRDCLGCRWLWFQGSSAIVEFIERRVWSTDRYLPRPWSKSPLLDCPFSSRNRRGIRIVDERIIDLLSTIQKKIENYWDCHEHDFYSQHKPSHMIGCLASGSGPHKIGIEWRFHFFFFAFVWFSLYSDTNLLLFAVDSAPPLVVVIWPVTETDQDARDEFSLLCHRTFFKPATTRFQHHWAFSRLCTRKILTTKASSSCNTMFGDLERRRRVWSRRCFGLRRRGQMNLEWEGVGITRKESEVRREERRMEWVGREKTEVEHDNTCKKQQDGAKRERDSA